MCHAGCEGAKTNKMRSRSEQTNKQTDRQTNKLSNKKKTSKQANRQANKQTNKQASKQADKQTNKPSQLSYFCLFSYYFPYFLCFLGRPIKLLIPPPLIVRSCFGSLVLPPLADGVLVALAEPAAAPRLGD